MAVDFPNTVVNYILSNFQSYVNTGLDVDDPLYLESVVRGPLQADPTKAAYFLYISPDYPKPEEGRDGKPWRLPVAAMSRNGLGSGQDIPGYAIGGGLLYANFFRMEGWIPSQTSFEAAYDIGGQALRRLERGWTIFAHDTLDAGVLETDDGNETVESYPHIFNNDGAYFTTTGGSRTIFPRLCLKFHVYSRVDRDYQLGV